MARFKENDLPKSKITASSLNKAKIIFLILFTSLAYSQVFFESDNSILNKKNEIRIDIFKFLIGCNNLSYEHHLNKDFSIGISGMISTREQKYEYDYGGVQKFSVEPFVRYSLSKNLERFYYVELFTSLNGGNITNTERIVDNNFGYYKKVKSEYTDLAFGISFGRKWYIRKKICVDNFVGVGNNIYKYHDDKTLIRWGINIGYRF
jgi:Protein of unknown function (DUF3575)